MALINCPECGKEISSSAISCPNCGYGVKKHFDDIKAEEERAERQQRRDLQSKKNQEYIKSCNSCKYLNNRYYHRAYR